MKSKLLGHSANDLFWFILPLLLPSLLDKYDLSYSRGGAILTIYLTVTALGSFVMGRLSDRFSKRRIIAFGLISSASGLMLAGFAPSLTVFMVILSLTAVGVSTFHPVMYAVLDEQYSRNKEKVMSLYETAGTTAILFMFLINGFLLEIIGTGGVLVLTALPSLAMGFYFLFSTSIEESKTRLDKGTDDSKGVSAAYQMRFAFFLASVMFRVVAVAAILNFLPTILVDYLKFSRETASYGTAFFFAGGIAGSLAAGKYSRRLSPMKVLTAGTLLIFPAIAGLTLNLPGWGYLAVIAVFGFFGSGCIISQNLLMTSMGKHLGKGEVFGVLMGVLTLTSAFSPALFGAVVDSRGFYSAILLFSAPLILSTVILMAISTGKSKRAAEK